MYNRFDSYYYSRPVSYRSYYPKMQKPQILKENDPDTQDVINFFTKEGISFQNLGGLSRGIRFDDIEVGKRKFNHHANNIASEYYIHQWKSTNDLSSYHPTGTHIVTKSYQNFLNDLNKVVQERKKKY